MSTAETLQATWSREDISCHLHPFTVASRHEDLGPLTVVRGTGCTVETADGRQLLDALGGLACVGLGWGEHRLADAAHRQMMELAYGSTFGHRSHPRAIELASRLVAIAPGAMAKVFFANSGSEANDTAVKLSWLYHTGRGEPERRKILSHRRGYHGTTVASASLTGLEIAHAGFGLPLPGFLHVETPHYYRGGRSGETEDAFATRLVDAIDDLITREGPETVAAFVTEPVLATGGMIVPPTTYFERLQPVLQRHGVLLVVDEVITGFGRTGKAFASTAFGLRPDMLVLAKQLSSAYVPISALLMGEHVYGGIRDARGSEALGTGFTYSGHPVAAAVALETLSIYEERDIVARACEAGHHLHGRLHSLAGHPLVGEIRGMGLLAGIELVADRKRHTPFPPTAQAGAHCAARMLDHGVVVRALGSDTIALTPPLTITREEIDHLVEAFARSLEDTHHWAISAGLMEGGTAAA